MAVTKIAPARVKVQIAGPRGVAGPAGPEGPGGPKRLRVLAMVTHSWGHVDTLSPLNSERQAMQDALDTEYGVGTWLVVRYTLGGSALGPVGIQPRGLEMLQRALARGDVDTVWLQHGVNDLALGRTDSQFIGDLTTAAGYCSSAGKNLVVSTIGPFKGTGPDGSGSIHTVYSDAPTNTVVDPTATAAKYTLLKGYADAINSHILTTFGAKAHDEYDLFNTVGNDGVFRVDMRFDDFHPSHAGKVASAAKFVAEQDLGTASGTAPAISITRDVNVDQDLTRQSSVAHKSVRVGNDRGEIAPVTIIPFDPLVDGPAIAIMQRIHPNDSGWLESVLDDGGFTFTRLAGGSAQVPTLRIAFGGPSLHNGPLFVADDASGFRLSGTTYGGGAGVALQITAKSGGMQIDSFDTGGSTYGYIEQRGDLHVWSINSTPTAQVYSGAVAPASNNAVKLGDSGLRWSEVYAVNGTINTSDGEEKTKMEEPPDGFFDAILSVPIGAWRWLDAVTKKGERARWHVGPIAQNVRDALAEAGLDPHRWGLFCEDDEVVPVTKTRKVKRPAFDDVEVEDEKIVVGDDGIARATKQVRTERRQRFEQLPLYESDGKRRMVPDLAWKAPADNPEAKRPLIPAIYSAPVLEEVEEEYTAMEPTGRKTLGLRLDQFHAARSEGLRRRFEADKSVFESRIAALEKRLSSGRN